MGITGLQGFLFLLKKEEEKERQGDCRDWF